MEHQAFVMSNEELDTAINTAARHSTDSFGKMPCGKLMLAHLEKLLRIQLQRAEAIKLSDAEMTSTAALTRGAQE